MTLLDVIIDPTDTFRPRPKPVVPDTILPADTTDTVASTVNTLSGGNQQVADIAPLPPETLTGDDFSTLLWTIFVVLVALSLCFYFVRKYRRTKTS